ncbi:RNI-like protein [Coccomyxa subellipsoidea C-169]|uniref:RNI-like protein n=1 Tax=Coccomyxa subellipsoidea (strain C-169) TaxID=574566 RepID=I0YSM9_COCSC|nr:RNI-like protein [Coccomyxa subellipsoidea C-169]EIE21398.1 RNI-like protein [Coccomyxa subellipsoidea C-169]|eukprot:XP_005645942.1 RNI-like protein [Coccomyxa subellipsoidea C-169]
MSCLYASAPACSDLLCLLRRAAHFAHYANADDSAEEDNLHTGGNEARTLGPWSSARQLVEGRAAAAAAREDKIAAAAQAVAAAEAEADWRPRRDPALGPRVPPRVGKLFSMCLAVLVEYIDDVETLYGMPTMIKVQLARAVADARRMTPEVLRLFTDDGPDEVVLPECSQLMPATLAEALVPCATPRLERLELGLCGRGFGDAVAAAMVAGGQLSRLRSLTLGGAYRTTDADLAKLLAAAPDLAELRLPQCSRLQDACAIARLTPNLEMLDLTECRGISVQSLQQCLTSLKSLRVLELNGDTEVTDDLLTEVALACPLRRLGVSNCSAVTDRGVRGVAAAAPQLTALIADDVGRLTDAALVALSESCRDIQEVSLRRCTKVTDVGVAALTLSGKLRSLNMSGIAHVGPASIKALATSCKESLEELDVSWCRGVPEAWLGVLADSCTNLLRLTIFGCSQVTTKLLNGHTNDALEIVGATAQKTPPPSVARIVLRPEA